MLRTMFSFFSLLAIGVLSAAGIVTIMPWLSGQAEGATFAAGRFTLHFESLLFGVVLGILIGSVGRYNWGEIPRRVVTWFIVRERLLFYYALIAGCVAVLLFY